MFLGGLGFRVWGKVPFSSTQPPKREISLMIRWLLGLPRLPPEKVVTAVSKAGSRVTASDVAAAGGLSPLQTKGSLRLGSYTLYLGSCTLHHYNPHNEGYMDHKPHPKPSTLLDLAPPPRSGRGAQGRGRACGRAWGRSRARGVQDRCLGPWDVCAFSLIFV